MTLISDHGEPGMFERYTDRAKRVLALAQNEARGLRHDAIGTEHLLLGLIGEGGGVAFQALDALGITPAAAGDVVLKRHPAGTIGQDRHIPYTSRAKKVFEYALREAIELGSNYIATEHLLLGLIREGEDTGAVALRSLVPLLDVRAKVLTLLHGYAKSERGRETAPVLPSLPWRTSNHNGRTLYAQAPGGDVPIGMLDTPELAAEACEAHNYRLALRQSPIAMHPAT